MTVNLRSTPRRLSAALAAVVVAAGLALAGPAGAVGDTGTDRIQGADRYATAAAVALDSFPDGATTAVLATGQAFADALSASGLAGALNAPVLLTLTDDVPQATLDALETLETTDIVLMGGEAAISASVEEALVDQFETVSRVEGDDRFGTAAAAAAAIAETDDSNPVTTDDGLGSTSQGVTAMLTSGLSFPDAVSASQVSYAIRLPILLATTDVLPQATIDAITDNGIEHVVIVGGTGVIGSTVKQQLEEDLEVTTERVAGVNRWQTNTEVVAYGVEEAGLDPASTFLATGANFPDALVAGPAAGAAGEALLLVFPTVLPDPTKAFIEAEAGVIDFLRAIGGPSAVAAETVTAAAEAAVLDSYDVLAVSPTSSSSKDVSTNVTNNDGQRLYTVTGLEPGLTYNIALLEPSAVESQGGTTHINRRSDGSLPLTDEASTAIESVNGSPTGFPAGSGGESVATTGDAEDDGTLTFTIDATEADGAIPIVYLDRDEDGSLDFFEDVPDEPFGLGGLTTWS